MDFSTAALLLPIVAFAAGWIDSVVGGGGLLQLPALMIAVPGAPVATLLGTNKLASAAGMSMAALTYTRRLTTNRRIAWLAGLLGIGAAATGAACAGAMSSAVLRPMVLAVLVGVLAIVVLRPGFGATERVVPRPVLRGVLATAVAGLAIGFYDGILGPGTGAFLVLAFTGLIGTDFLRSSALAKIVNTGTNVGALTVFALQGHVLWSVGLGMAVASVLGARLGSITTLRRGATFVRAVLICTAISLILKLGYDEFG
ncbi:TSUP family transporter [Nocardia arthritidis]|uniref:Probable membrane transporter protein n=1 Tax=Nocardia arthritidis TaxID=228602 RepID=A0A6G9YDY7_9NOCA|nr:TSUP family transporter [Nocardia arthritidis]QIS11441.1 TSUP family transporter [Nocardia arthritidis]